MPPQHPRLPQRPRHPWRSRLAGLLRGAAEAIDPAPAGLDLDGAPAFWAERVRADARQAKRRGEEFSPVRWSMDESAPRAAAPRPAEVPPRTAPRAATPGAAAAPPPPPMAAPKEPKVTPAGEPVHSGSRTQALPAPVRPSSAPSVGRAEPPESTRPTLLPPRTPPRTPPRAGAPDVPLVRPRARKAASEEGPSRGEVSRETRRGGSTVETKPPAVRPIPRPAPQPGPRVNPLVQAEVPEATRPLVPGPVHTVWPPPVLPEALWPALPLRPDARPAALDPTVTLLRRARLANEQAAT